MRAQSVAAALEATFQPPLAVDEIRLIGPTRTFARDQAVFDDGDPADAVYKVVSGAVRAFRLLADGRRQIIGFHLPGDLFGLELGDRRRAAASALGPTTLVVARRASLAGEPQQLLRLALGELQRAHDHALTLGRRTAGERVAGFLADLATRLGAGAAFELPMSRLDIADHLGLTIETVSRTLTQLQADGLVSLSGCRRVRLPRPEALAELCE